MWRNLAAFKTISAWFESMCGSQSSLLRLKVDRIHGGYKKALVNFIESPLEQFPDDNLGEEGKILDVGLGVSFFSLLLCPMAFTCSRVTQVLPIASPHCMDSLCVSLTVGHPRNSSVLAGLALECSKAHMALRSIPSPSQPHMTFSMALYILPISTNQLWAIARSSSSFLGSVHPPYGLLSHPSMPAT
eukprot:Gb_12664 [translate_table: standard]